MARRRVNMLEGNETLSNETPEVQEKLLEEIIEPDNNQDNKDEQVSTKNNELNNLPSDVKDVIMDEPVDSADIIKPGDRVKIDKHVSTDTIGRRIHAGVKNYVYTVRSIRPDGIACVECLTHVFNVKLVNLIKIN